MRSTALLPLLIVLSSAAGRASVSHRGLVWTVRGERDGVDVRWWIEARNPDRIRARDLPCVGLQAHTDAGMEKGGGLSIKAEPGIGCMPGTPTTLAPGATWKGAIVGGGSPVVPGDTQVVTISAQLGRFTPRKVLVLAEAELTAGADGHATIVIRKPRR
jgi:hypothetical protein